MPVGGSFNKDAFQQQDPLQMLWARRLWNWDTQNPFAKGVAGVQSVGSHGMVRGRQSAMDLGVQAPVGQLQQAVARPVNMLANPRQLNFGGRDYGDQSIDRNEIARIKQMGATGAKLVAPIAGAIGQRWAERRANKVAESEAIPTATTPTPHPIASSNWREEQAARRAEYAPGASSESSQPTLDVSADSRAYQEERAQERANRPPTTEPTPATSQERLANAAKRQEEMKAARQQAGSPAAPLPGGTASRRPSGLPQPSIFAQPKSVTTPSQPVSTSPSPVVASPVTPVGDQSARLAAEGTTTPGGTVNTGGGVKSTSKPLTKSLTKPLTKTTSGSRGVAGPNKSAEGTTAKNPRRKR